LRSERSSGRSHSHLTADQRAAIIATDHGTLRWGRRCSDFRLINLG